MAGEGPVLESQMVPFFLRALRGAGGDVDALVARLGLCADAERRREVEVSFDALDEIANAAATQAGDPDLGLHLAVGLPRGSYGLLEYIGRSAATVGDAAERFVRYSLLLNDAVTFTLERQGPTAILTQRVPGRPSCVGRHAGEMCVALFVRFFREMSGADVRPVAVAFAHEPPIDTSELEAFFRVERGPIAFRCGENRVVLPTELLERPLVGADPALAAVLEEQAERLLELRSAEAERRRTSGATAAGTAAGAAPDTDRLANVRERIRLALEHGQPTLDGVAAALRMSPRTLQRRLADAGTTFQQLVDDVRHGLARAYMENASFALGDVAYLLGFSEISAFTRAFKRWTGMTPRQWRARSTDLA